MSNETRAQGFELYIVDDLTAPSTPALLKVGNLTDLGEFGAMLDDIEVTNLDSVAKEYIQGLPDNGEMSLQANLDRTSAAHKLLWKLSKLAPSAGESRKKFIILGSDGTDVPTLDSNDDIVPPADREWWSMLAAVKSFRFPVSVNTVVKATIGLRISGAIESSMDS